MSKKYVRGLSIEEAKAVSGKQKIIKLGSNENALGPSPKAQEAIRKAISGMHLYPGREEELLIDKLVTKTGSRMTPEQFITGNGSCDTLRMITQAFMSSGKKALIGAPTFSMYEMLTTMFGGQPELIPLKNYTMDLPAIASAVDDDVSIIFVCNPNNPTGTTVTQQQVAAFLDALPSNIPVVFDEAYGEFVDDSDFPQMLDFIDKGYPVLVTRTFSKLFGLASLRIGYAYGNSSLMEKVRKNKLPFNSGKLAYLGAAAALDDEAFIANTLAMVRKGKDYYYHSFDAMGIHYIPTQSNFVFLTDLPKDAGLICDEALKRGIILRPTTPFGLPDNIRITIGREEENQRVIETLKEILAE